MILELWKLSEEDLLRKTQEAILEERRATLAVLHCLMEIETRRIYLDRGFGSLFEFVVQHFGYSESAAYRRIQAMRLIRNFPEAESKIEKGRITLTNASHIYNFMKSRTREEGFEMQERQELLKLAENKSTAQLKKELAGLDPEFLPRETIRAINELEYELTLILDEQLVDRLDHLKSLLSHRNHRMLYRDLIEELSDLGELQWDPTRRISLENRNKPDPTYDPLKKTKTIPVGIRRAVWLRDQGCCAYQDPRTKRRCGSTHLLQIDHIQPLALGGEHRLSNLRLLCAAHNQHRAQRTFGWKPEPGLKPERGPKSVRRIGNGNSKQLNLWPEPAPARVEQN